MYNTTFTDVCQPLIDKSGSGRKQPWAQHRSEAEILSVAYADIDPAKMDRLLACAPRLTFRQPVNGNEGMKLDTAWFCRVRLCPICQWRRSLKVYGQMAEIVKVANAQAPGGNGYGWIMLTLTVKNVQGSQLSRMIDEIGKAWGRLVKVKEWKKIVLGTMRSLEVTHNADERSPSFDTYHPHLHVLICVRRSYFSGKDYLNQAKWTELWKAAARLNYTPQVNVKRIGNRDMSTEEIVKDIAEVTKYATKPSDYITASDVDLMERTVSVLDKALHKRRLVAWTGNLKEIRAKLQLDDVEDGDLIHTASKEQEEEEDHMLLTYSWLRERRNYFLEVEKDVIEDEERGQAAAGEVDSDRRIHQG